MDFADGGTEDIYNGVDSKAARNALPRELWRTAARKMLRVLASSELSDLRFPPGNRLEALVGDRAGQHSIRIDLKYRLCFRWSDDGASHLEIVDYH